MLKHLKPYYLQIGAVVMLTLGGIMLELLLPTLMADVVDKGIVNGDIPYIVETGAVMLACAFVAVLLMIGVSFFSSKVALGFGRDIRRSLFEHVETFSLQAFEKIGTASLITRTTNDVKQVQDVLNMILRMMTRAPLMLIGGTALAISREPGLSLVFLGALPLLALLIFFISRKAIPLYSTLQKKTDRLNLIVRENLIGIRVVRAFNKVFDEQKRFNRANEEYRDTGIKVNKLMALLFPIMLIVMNFTNIAIIWFGSLRIDQGMMQVGNLMAFLQYAMMILMALIMLSFGFIMIPRAQASARRINEVLQMESEVVDPDEPKDGKEQFGTVEFRNVTFRFEGAQKPVLEQITFRAEQGQTTAIIGSTGSGKTTLVQLILRFYDVEDGAVLVNGTDVREMSQQYLRAMIGYVPQEAILFEGTVAENMRYGKEATEEEIWNALYVAQAAPFIQSKGEGLDFKIEQSGANVSGGQKQRLSIARALIRKAPIYIFDDSFSALDFKTDASLRAALATELSEATILIVAQRVSTVMKADQIVVLDEGKIVGIGTHEQLLADNVIYQEIVSSQYGKEEEA